MSKKADAVWCPEALKGDGASQYIRADNVLNVVEPLLGADRSKGITGHIRRQPGGRLFVTLDPLDTLKYPNGHDRAGEERYTWEEIPGSGGVFLGYLKEPKQEAASAQPPQ